MFALLYALLHPPILNKYGAAAAYSVHQTVVSGMDLQQIFEWRACIGGYSATDHRAAAAPIILTHAASGTNYKYERRSSLLQLGVVKHADAPVRSCFSSGRRHNGTTV